MARIDRRTAVLIIRVHQAQRDPLVCVEGPLVRTWLGLARSVVLGWRDSHRQRRSLAHGLIGEILGVHRFLLVVRKTKPPPLREAASILLRIELSLAANPRILPNGDWLPGNNDAKKLNKGDANDREGNQLQFEHDVRTSFRQMLRRV